MLHRHAMSFLILLLTISVGCGKDKSANPPQDTDPNALTVRLISPADGATVTGQVEVVAEATGAAMVTFLVDGAEIGSVASAPYRQVWNTETTENGPRTLRVVASREAESVDARVTVSVANEDGGLPVTERTVVGQMSGSGPAARELADESIDTVAQAVFLASISNGGTLTVTGTLTQTAPGSEDFTWTPQPPDRMLIVFAGGGPTVEIIVARLSGFLGGDWEDFRDHHDDLAFRIAIAGTLDLSVESASGRPGSPLAGTGIGSFLPPDEVGRRAPGSMSAPTALVSVLTGHEAGSGPQECAPPRPSRWSRDNGIAPHSTMTGRAAGAFNDGARKAAPASRVEFGRAVTGTMILGGTTVTLNLTHQGSVESEVEPGFARRETEALISGTIDSPQGRVTVDYYDQYKLVIGSNAVDQWVNANVSSATVGGVTLRFLDVLIRGTCLNNIVSELEFWRGQGTLLRDDVPIGNVRYAGPVFEGLPCTRPPLVIDLGGGVVIDY